MNRKKIIIADDEADIRRLVKNILGTYYMILEASNGEQAVNITRTEKPALVLMDILMPKMDGYTACHAIKTNQVTQAIPVVMLTAVGHKLNQKLAQDLGANGYITKPFGPRELLDIIDRLLAAS